jgi:hypothetical protein
VNEEEPIVAGELDATAMLASQDGQLMLQRGILCLKAGTSAWLATPEVASRGAHDARRSTLAPHFNVNAGAAVSFSHINARLSDAGFAHR